MKGPDEEVEISVTDILEEYTQWPIDNRLIFCILDRIETMKNAGVVFKEQEIIIGHYLIDLRLCNAYKKI